MAKPPISIKRGHKFSCVKTPQVFKNKKKYNRKNKKDKNAN